MAEEYPIPEQQGPTKEQLDAMKPTTQKFSKLTEQQLLAQTGVSAQVTKLANNLRKSLIDYLKAKQSADMSKEYSMDDCIKSFSNDLANIIVSVISAQAITVTTTVATTVVGTSATGGPVTGTGSGTGTATPQQVTST